MAACGQDRGHDEWNEQDEELGHAAAAVRGNAEDALDEIHDCPPFQ